jgi:hypothetical protein
MGLRLLPGFAGGTHRRVGLGAAVWAIALAHGAAVLRVVPPLAVWLLSAAGQSADGLSRAAAGAEAIAGVAGVLAIAAFAYALRCPLQPDALPQGHM